MNIKRFVKTHCPKILLPIISAHYRALKQYPFRRKVEKYLPHYQDELSREILSDRLKFLKTYDLNIFVDRLEKIGMKFHELCYCIPCSINDISRIVLLYDNGGWEFHYTQRVLSLLDWSGSCRLMTLKDFLGGAEIADTEMIVCVLTQTGKLTFSEQLKVRSIKAKVFPRMFYLTNTELQYFDVFCPVDDEIVVDAGAYDGATAIKFLEWGRGKVKHVYSFEFDLKNAAKCEENLKPYADRVTLVKKGTWDKDEIIHVSASGGSGSTLRSQCNTEVHLTTIDSVVQDEHVTFIKMDVEGAELKSLVGARNTILKNHPRLAICVYHKDSDLWEIPGYILSLVPEYKFYLRHYCTYIWETILYAYCDE